MKYSLLLIPQARRELDSLEQKTFIKVKQEISALSTNPRPVGSIKLTADEGYRIRVGDYRVLYRINDRTKEVFIYRIKHRKDVYR